jgi:hypothetical protein
MKNGNTFNELSLNNKILLLEDTGIELISIEHYDHRIYLYSFDSFFVEIYVNIETRQVEKILVAKYGDLDKYLSRIIIESISIGRNRSQAPML